MKELVADTRAGAWLDSLLQDLRYAERMLLKSPAFTLAAALLIVPTTDPASLGRACTILLAVAALACWIPGRRASRVDPAIALRES